MTRTFFAALVLMMPMACSSSGGSEIVGPRPVLTIEHSEGADPRGYLQVEVEGSWMFGNPDACRFTKGDVAPERLTQIEEWVNDEGLKPFVTRDGCMPTDYVVTGSDVRMCWPQDAMPDTDSARSLVAVFTEYAAKLNWDGVKRDCSSENLTAQPSGRTQQTDAPPLPRAGAAGSGG